MSAVPKDFEESARIDGATNLQLLLKVMVPLAKPGIATITMLSVMGFWNEYPLALVLLTDDAQKTLRSEWQICLKYRSMRQTGAHCLRDL